MQTWSKRRDSSSSVECRSTAPLTLPSEPREMPLRDLHLPQPNLPQDRPLRGLSLFHVSLSQNRNQNQSQSLSLNSSLSQNRSRNLFTSRNRNQSRSQSRSRSQNRSLYTSRSQRQLHLIMSNNLMVSRASILGPLYPLTQFHLYFYRLCLLTHLSSPPLLFFPISPPSFLPILSPSLPPSLPPSPSPPPPDYYAEEPEQPLYDDVQEEAPAQEDYYAEEPEQPMYDDVQGDVPEPEQELYDDVQGEQEPDQPLYDDATGGGGEEVRLKVYTVRNLLPNSEHAFAHELGPSIQFHGRGKKNILSGCAGFGSQKRIKTPFYHRRWYLSAHAYDCQLQGNRRL